MILDSGDRTKFGTGAVRDMHVGKGRMDLLPWAAIIEVSKHCEEGALKCASIMWTREYLHTRFWIRLPDISQSIWTDGRTSHISGRRLEPFMGNPDGDQTPGAGRHAVERGG